MSDKTIATVPNAGKREFAKTMAYGGAGTLALTGIAALIPFVGPVLLSFLFIFAGMYMLAKY